MMTTEMTTVLWDERAIQNAMLEFGRTLDAGDWEGHRACLKEVVAMDFKRLTGFDVVRVRADDWVEFAKQILSPVRRHHTYTNFRPRIEGDRAFLTLKQTSRHWKSSDTGNSDYTQYGSYDVWFDRVGESWKIDYLKHDFVWSDGNNALFDMREPALVAALERVFCEENFAAAAANPPI